MNKREIKERGKINGLSPKQIKELIKKDVDFANIDDYIRALMEDPDIKYMQKVFLPEKRKIKESIIDPDDVLMATIVGDIIGSFREFSQYDFKNIKNEEFFTDKNFYTDDTVLSIATKHAILKNSKNPDFRSAYIEAYNKHPDAGYGSGFVCWATNTMMFYKDGMDNTTKIDNTKGYGSCANGSAMRISYIPAYYENINDVIYYTIASAMTTHSHVDGVKGSIVLSVCIWMALHGYTKQQIYDYCRKHYKYTADEKQNLIYKWCLFDLDSKLPEYSDIVNKNSLFCNYAVPFVIKCFYETDNYDSCIRKILSYFGDADTLCAMASGLCYAFYRDIPYDTEEIKEKYLKGLNI